MGFWLLTGGLALVATLSMAVLVMQDRLVRLREDHLGQMVAHAVVAVRNCADGLERMAPLYEDMILRDPSIAETLKIDLLDLQDLAKQSRAAAGRIDSYLSLTDPRQRSLSQKRRELRNLLSETKPKTN